MVGIVARRGYTAEITLGSIIVTLHEGHVTHTQVILVLVFGCQTLVTHLRELLLGALRIVQNAVICSQRELYLVGI